MSALGSAYYTLEVRWPGSPFWQCRLSSPSLRIELNLIAPISPTLDLRTSDIIPSRHLTGRRAKITKFVVLNHSSQLDGSETGVGKLKKRLVPGHGTM